MKKLMFSVAIAATTGALCAQEMGTAPAATQTTAVAVAATVTETSTLATAAAAAEDGASEIIAKAAEKGSDLAAEEIDNSVSSDSQVQADLDKMGLSIGYDSDRKAIIQIGTAVLPCKDPANDPGFMILREQGANIAYLDAKANIIKAINANFQGVDRSVMCTDESVDENERKVAEATRAVEAKRAELVDALAQYNAADAKSVSDVTLNDRFNVFLDAVIKKIDTSYDPAAIAASKKIDAAAAKVEAEALKAKARQLAEEYKVLSEAAAKLQQDPALESSSAAKLSAKMPLLGSSVLTQAESWDGEAYSVTIAVVWSPKLQATAVKMGTGDFSATGKPGKFNKAQWVKAQDWRSMVGGRRFTDDKGRNLFVGISAVDLAGPIVKQNAKKKIADTMAIKNVAMSLIADLETYREASQNLAVYADDSKKASQKLAEKTSSKVDINLKGCMQLASKTVKHPISGKKIYVSAFYIDPSMAAEAGKTLEKLYSDAVRVNKHTQKERGKEAGMQKALDAAKQSQAAFEAGKAQGAAAVNANLAAEEAAKKAAETKKAAEARAAAAAKAAKERRAAVAAKLAADKKAAEAKAEKVKTDLNARKEAEANAVSTPGVHSGGTIDTDF